MADSEIIDAGEGLVKLTLRLDTGTPPEIIAEQISRISPQYLPSLAIQSAIHYEASRDAGDLNSGMRALRLAQALTHYIYGHRTRGQDIVFPYLHNMVKGSTDTGALGIAIDPDRTYPLSGHSYFVLKEATPTSADQAFKDSRFFQDSRDFPLEHIVAKVPMNPMNDQLTYLWKQFIIGPDMSDLLSVLDDGIKRAPNEKKTIISLESALSGIAAERLFHWQQNAPLLDAEPRDYKRVVEIYIKNIIEALGGFANLTDSPINQSDIERFNALVRSMDWNFVNGQTTVRNLGATYRNWVLQTGKIRLTYDDMIRMFTEPNGKGPRVNKESLKQSLFFVDTPSKYSHALEDGWEMDLVLEGKHKEKAVDILKTRYSSLDPGKKVIFPARDEVLMHAYRAIRRAFLVLTKHWDRNDNMFTSGDITQEDYERNMLLQQGDIGYLLQEGHRAMTQLARYSRTPESREAAAIIGKLGEYKTIRPQPPLIPHT